MPSTVVSLLLTIAALAPGYLFELAAAKRVVRTPRSDLFAAIHMAIIGSMTTTFSAAGIAIGLLTVGNQPPERVAAFVLNPLKFTEASPQQGFWGFMSLVAALVSSYAVAYVGGAILYRRAAATIEPDSTAWRRSMGAMGQDVFATVYLKGGGTVGGWVRAFTPGYADSRELMLGSPIRASWDGGEPLEQSDDVLVITEDAILALGVQYSGRDVTSPRSRWNRLRDRTGGSA